MSEEPGYNNVDTSTDGDVVQLFRVEAAVRATLKKNPVDIEAMFDGVVGRYDITNTIITAGHDNYWRWRATRALGSGPGDTVLDVAAGTGRSTRSLQRAGARVVACDISSRMLAAARKRDPGLEAVHGSATALPFADAAFDAVTISFGLRNIDQTDKALAEMFRVTKPGGRIAVCEFTMPSNRAVTVAHKFYMTRVIPALVRTITPASDAYDYLAESISTWLPKDSLSELITAQGWSDVKYTLHTFGILAIHTAVKP